MMDEERKLREKIEQEVCYSLTNVNILVTVNFYCVDNNNNCSLKTSETRMLEH